VDCITDYYKSADSYAEMLRGQQTDAFTPYIELFEQFANQNDSVIDVGCGVGTSTLLLRHAGFNAIGTDVSEMFLPSESGIFCTADFQNAKAFPSNKYWAVGALNVIEHIERPKAFLSEMVRVARPEGYIILMSPNLTSPLVPLRILKDLLTKRTPYLGITRFSAAYRLILTNLWRSLRAGLGWSVFETRRPTLDTGIVGYDVDAVYWTNATEVRRFLESRGCEIRVFQRRGRSALAKILAYLLPGFAGQLCIVARKSNG
jgi:SAM-dependent methyltransferase